MEKGNKKEDFSMLAKKEPEKSLILPLRQSSGRSKVTGRITVRHQGGGMKKFYRIINFGEEKLGISGKVLAIEYDPNRTSFIALIEYKDGERGYIIAPQGLRIGDEIICNEKIEIKIGNRMKLKNIPIGTFIHNIEIEAGKGGKLIRSAGTMAKVIAQEERYTHLEMPSKEIRKFLNECYASIGQVSRIGRKDLILGKAGRSRHLGIRPSVRGKAMRAFEHPHGGGKGKAPIGLKFPKTPWGKPARGVRTRKAKWTDKYIIKRRR